MIKMAFSSPFFIISVNTHTVEHSAVNRVVAGKVQLGEPKDVTINSLLMTQVVHPASSWTSLIESRSCDPLSYRFVARPFSKKRGFSETTITEHGS